MFSPRCLTLLTCMMLSKFCSSLHAVCFVKFVYLFLTLSRNCQISISRQCLKLSSTFCVLPRNGLFSYTKCPALLLFDLPLSLKHTVLYIHLDSFTKTCNQAIRINYLIQLLSLILTPWIIHSQVPLDLKYYRTYYIISSLVSCTINISDTPQVMVWELLHSLPCTVL